MFARSGALWRANEELGWGLAGESWQTMEALEALGGETWFRLGDRDMATHIRRTQLRRGGATLTEATAELAARLDVPARLLPMSDDEVRTEIGTADGWLEFQEYFVKRGQADEVAVGIGCPYPGLSQAAALIVADQAVSDG